MDAIARLPKTKAPSVGHAAKLINRPADSSALEMLAAQAATASRMLKLLANKNRLLVLCALTMRGEMKAGDLVKETGLSQSALSQHLALLRADGLIAYRRESQTLHYRVADPRAAQILNLLKDMYCGER
jgi:ArsR family transcriptional regulator, virulence genes transcriptional regulator